MCFRSVRDRGVTMVSLTDIKLTLHFLCSAVSWTCVWTGVGIAEQCLSKHRAVPAQCHSGSAPHSDIAAGTSGMAKQPGLDTTTTAKLPQAHSTPCQLTHSHKNWGITFPKQPLPEDSLCLSLYLKGDVMAFAITGAKKGTFTSCLYTPSSLTQVSFFFFSCFCFSDSFPHPIEIGEWASDWAGPGQQLSHTVRFRVHETLLILQIPFYSICTRFSIFRFIIR